MRTVALKLLAAAAAYGVYRYSKMTPDQKSNLRTKGKDFLNKYSGSLNNMFGQKKPTMNGAVSGSDY